MRVSATAKYLRHSTRKARLVTQAIVGLPVAEAEAALKFMPQEAARDVAKVLHSAAANAENNHNLSPDELVVVAGDGRRRTNDEALSTARPGSRIRHPQADDAHHRRRREQGGLSMGRKVHPYGFRLGTSRTWNAKWYADKNYTDLLKEDISIRQLVSRRLANASVSMVDIERGINHVTVTVHTAKPGIVIGKGGANVEALRQQIGRLTTGKVKLEIKEIRQPELDAVLVATNIAQQLTRRIAFRKALKQAIQRTMKAGAKGVRIAVSGRLGGAEMARREWDKEGRIPLNTLRADISYGQVHAHTTYGRIGVKVWIYRGDILPERHCAARAGRDRRRGCCLMLMPRRVKHRKVMRGRMSGMAKGGTEISFGDYGADDHEPALITARQIEAARRAMTRYVKRGGKVWIRIFPDKPVTKKPAEVRMGSGKGAPDHWVAVVKPGRILFEMAGVPENEADEAMRLAGHKLPVDVKFLVREGVGGDGHR